MVDTIIEGIELSYGSFEAYFDELSVTAEDSSVAPPMSYDPLFLGSLDMGLIEDALLSMAWNNPSFYEAALQDTLLTSTSVNRDLRIRSMSRKDYYEDSKLGYASERDYHTFRRNMNTQFLTTSTPKQRGT